jgi:hypothetical protein
MKESDVRKALHEFLGRTALLEEPGAMLVDELGVLEGRLRVDVALIGEQLQGYEIKSPADSLCRLENQQAGYGLVFDRMTLVCADKFVPQAVSLVPSWWGLIAVSAKEGQTILNEIWPARVNHRVCKLSMCQLLWREEALSVLGDHGLDYGLRTKSRKKMWATLARELELPEIRKAIRDKLSKRADWRA